MTEAERAASEAGAKYERAGEVTDDMLECALDAYVSRLCNTSDGLTAPKRRAEAMRAALEAVWEA